MTTVEADPGRFGTPVPPAPSRPPATVRLARLELAKQARRPRGWVTVAVMAGISTAVALIVAVSSPALAERLGDWSSVVTNSSGFTLPLIALNAMLIFMLPLSAAVFAGETVAGEAAWGSLRALLARPVRRWRVLGAKAAVAALWTLLTVVAVVALPWLVGLADFGWRSLTVVDLQHSSAFHLASATFGPGEALLRLAGSAAFVAVTLASTFSFALLLSGLTRAPFAAVAGGVGLSLVSRALDNIPGLHALSPWLPVTDGGAVAWTGLWSSPVQGDAMLHALLVQLVYTVLFLGAAWFSFSRSDVLT